MFVQQLVNGVSLGLVYALVAVGYAMVYGVIERINFAHGELAMLGAYVCAISIQQAGLGFFPALGVAMLVAALTGVLLDRFAYRPLRDAPRIAALITAVGASLVLQNLALLLWGARPRPFPRDAAPDFFFETAFTLSGAAVSGLQLFLLVSAMLFTSGLFLLVRKTRLGLAMRALAENRSTARLMGVRVDWVTAATFAVGSALGGFAGVVSAMTYNQLSPTMGAVAGVKAFAAAVLGGIGSIPGALVGGLLLGVVEALGAGYVSSLYRDGAAFAALIVVVLVRPTGLFGKKVLVKV